MVRQIPGITDESGNTYAAAGRKQISDDENAINRHMAIGRVRALLRDMMTFAPIRLA
jgi:hypothetical protein